MTSVRILSVNCQGLGNIAKRTDVFNYLKKKQCNIYCLQDTHFTCENEKSIHQVGIMNVILAHLHQMPGVLLFFLTIILNLIFLKRKET